jgi:cytochrome c oxidase subunit 1
MMNEKLGYLHFWITFPCAYLVFFPMYFLGLDGVPRRYYAFTEFEFMQKWVSVNILITSAAIAATLGQIPFLINFFYSIFWGKKAVQNPWDSNTLEWTTPVEYVHGKWPGALPEVHRWAYDYSKPGHPEDFIMQTVPYSQTMASNFAHDLDNDPELLKIQEEYNKQHNIETKW